MTFRRAMRLYVPFVALAVFTFGQVRAQSPGAPVISQADKELKKNAQQGQFTFVLFYKTRDASTQTLTQAVENGIAATGYDASLTYVQVANPAEKQLVDRLGVSRAPMPLCVAIAPNGAVTGVFRKKPTLQAVANAFVTPVMTQCMKAMQDGKIVLVCIQSAPRPQIAQAVKECQADPQFKNRVATVMLNINDRAESDFLAQLDIDGANQNHIATVMLAPPGVLVGKYAADASFDQMAAELHAVGKCCDDPNCQHQ